MRFVNRWVLIGLLGWGTSSAAPAPAPKIGTPLVWRIDQFANEFWVLDHLSGWDTDEGNAYATAFAQQVKLDDTRRELLARYAAVRRAHARDTNPPPEVRDPADMMPPIIAPAERFALAFLNATDERAAAATLGLDPAEKAVVLAAFVAFRKDIDRLLADSAYLAGAQKLLEQDIEHAHMSEFLDQMKAFYGIDDAAPYTVHLLWAPPHFGQATVWDHDVILPLTAASAADAKDLASWLGVLVHELGHSFLSEKPDADKRELSRRIVDAGGIVNQRHSNIVDEATQAALGNILFLRRHLPEGFEDGSFYNYDPKSEYPDAIDSLARVAEPLVAASLGKRDSFAKEYLPKILEAQLALLGDGPLHHAHVGLIFTADRETSRHFDGLFWGRSRWSYDPAHVDDFVRDSRLNSTITRWVVLTEAEATPELVNKLEIPVAKGLALHRRASCARAARRTSNGGYDVFVLGRDSAALRRMLIELHRARTMPTTKPFCSS